MCRKYGQLPPQHGVDRHITLSFQVSRHERVGSAKIDAEKLEFNGSFVHNRRFGPSNHRKLPYSQQKSPNITK